MITTNLAYGYPASEFVFKYGTQFEEGEKVRVLVIVKGEPETNDPAKKAKEIRYFQSGVLKFIHFAGATNVISDTQKNQFTATMTTSLAEKVAVRYDVITVTVLDSSGNPIENLCSPIGPGADLSGCNLYGRLLKNADLQGANLSNANLKGADLTGANLSGADLSFAFLKHALINEANLTNANFAFAKVTNAEVTNSDLTNANFYRATLYRSDFTNSDLSDTDFRYAILTYAILASTNLDGANLENAGTWATNLNGCYNHEICE